MPLSIRATLCLSAACNCAANKLLVSMDGSVPMPNAIMMLAPCKALALVVANNNIEYTNPHGSQPHKNPIATALSVWVPDSCRVAKG
jgi:hypothetical protein